MDKETGQWQAIPGLVPRVLAPQGSNAAVVAAVSHSVLQRSLRERLQACPSQDSSPIMRNSYPQLDTVGELAKELAKPVISLEIGCCEPRNLVMIPSSPTVSN